MEQLNFDSGIREFQVNGRGVLRFNPSDPNVYSRYMDALPKIKTVEEEMAAKAKAVTDSEDPAKRGETAICLMRETDVKMKAVLAEIFGGANDFDAIFGNVNLMAVASNGERVITNFMNAIQPVMESGAKSFADSKVGEARLNREQRRAMGL